MEKTREVARLKNNEKSQGWWCMPVILTLERLKHDVSLRLAWAIQQDPVSKKR
jgi:hypothetical protein